MRKVLASIVLIFLCLVVQRSWAHSGRTDWRGGHHDRFSGGYHFHHGMGPHQHPGGVCPYSPEAKAAARANLSFAERHPLLVGAGIIAGALAVRSVFRGKA